MLSITPCQRLVSDRFPVASFVVHSPPDRLFEIACATDPVLFRGDHRHRRTRDNFFTTRASGLMRAPAGQATYLVPPEQLRRFAGARRLYYALGSYAGMRGEDARFTDLTGDPAAVPCIQISPDFTGQSLDRTRLGRRAEPAAARYGAGKNGELLWGGDLIAPAGRAGVAASHEQPRLGHGVDTNGGYDDGYSSDLWSGRRSSAMSAPTGGPSPDGMDLDEPEGYEDAPDIAAAAPAPLPGANPAPVPLTPPTAAGAPAAQPMRLGRAVAARPPQVRAGVPVLGGSRRTLAEPTGFEDGVALARAHGASRGAPATLSGRPGPRPGLTLGGRPAARMLADDSPAVPSAVAFPPAAPAPAAAPAGHDPDYDDDGDTVEPDLPTEAADAEIRSITPPTPLTIPEKFKIVALVSRAESGGPPAGYALVNADGEYNDPRHPYYHRDHMGLSWGLVQFTQRSGALGRVLSACQRRDPEQFASVMGPAADELLRVTNAPTADERLAPVGGSLLWTDAWPARFQGAGAVTAFQAAQNEVAIEGYLDPNLTLARWLGFDTDRALAMLYDRCVNMGNGGGRMFVVDAVSPVRSQPQLTAALNALGYGSLAEFQGSVTGLVADGHWRPLTNAALIAALRTLGPASPVAIPDREAMLDRLVQAASGRWFAQRLADLRHTGELRDVSWTLAA